MVNRWNFNLFIKVLGANLSFELTKSAICASSTRTDESDVTDSTQRPLPLEFVLGNTVNCLVPPFLAVRISSANVPPAT